MQKLVVTMMCLMALFLVGCGSPGGQQGDSNDPAVSGSDAAQQE